MGDLTREYLELLSEKYPNEPAVCSELIKLRSVLSLPKGTEHFISDLHGEYAAVRHILNNCSGVILEKVRRLFGDTLGEERCHALCSVIYYPPEALNALRERGELTDERLRETLESLRTLAETLSSKYTRGYVRRRMPEEWAFVLDELLHLQRDEDANQLRYHDALVSSVIASGAAEQLLGLPDLRAYMDAIYSLSSERFSSLGAVCLDIPNFAAINSSCGFEYGSRLLWYVAKTLADLFGYSYLYRTWDAEFIAFFPNTTREVFVGRCGRLRSIIQRRYPKEVRIGRAWAEGRFSGQTLVKEAKAAMHGEGLDTSDEVLGFAQRAEEYHSVGAAARAGRFTVYFQPKIDMRTGRLYGAEAMVRGIAEDGSIVAPGQFIEYLEQDGSIRDLDIYVLERSLDQADRWREEGLGLVPVATNISRATLVHPSTLASVLAVQSRYPHFPAEALELEVTERGGIETGEFRRIVERFRSCALRLSLDDFGSQYANLPLFTNVRFDTVKLDRSLITGLAGNPVSRMLVRDIVQICRAYGMDCVAVGAGAVLDHLDILSDVLDEDSSHF